MLSSTRAAASGEGLPSEPLVRVDAANVMPETVKPCEDGGHAFILRLYECEGSYARTRLSLAPGCSGARLCDMLEQPRLPPVRQNWNSAPLR